jgi:transposase
MQAKTLGYEVVGCHEYYTSAKCPRPTCDNFLENAPNRSKFCRNCHMHFDRDHVGAENIARVCEGQLMHQKRPEKYKPGLVATIANIIPIPVALLDFLGP